MHGVLGLDEAGYGPNLGPLVQAAVVLPLPPDDPAGWTSLQACVRRTKQKADGRLLIDDSKKVHAGPHAFSKLQTSVLAALRLEGLTWQQILARLGLPAVLADCQAEPWYDGTQSFAGEPACLPADFPHVPCWVNLVPPQRFNEMVRTSGSKATVLSQGLIALLQAATQTLPEPLHAFCDKQGGRQFYGPMLQEAFSTGWVMAERETADESRYRIEGLPHAVRVTFRPRADGDSVCVALASMVCKFLREVWMRQFNAYWQTRVPGLVATAGYPQDAKRFFAQIEPVMLQLGLAPDTIWRIK